MVPAGKLADVPPTSALAAPGGVATVGPEHPVAVPRWGRARRRRAVAACLVLASWPATARAQSTAELEGLLDQSVVSTASKAAAGAASTAPATITTITAEDLRRYGIHSLDEALNFLSLGMITEDPRQTVEIGARGVLFTRDFGAHVLLLVDGHVVNEPWGGTAYYDRGAGVPFEMIDHIEVILGPGSVLYGSNAMLGVISIVTKRAKDFAGARAVVESELPVSIRGAAGFGREFRLFGKPAEVTVGAEYFASRGPASSFGPQSYGADSVTGQPKRFSSLGPGTGVWGSAGNPDLFFRLAPSFYATFRAGGFELRLRGALWKRWSPFVGSTDLAGTSGYELDRWLSIDARYRATLSSQATLMVRAYGDLYDYREYDPLAAAEDCLAGQSGGCTYDLRGKARWVGAEIQSSFDWLKDGALVTLLGVDGRFRHTEGSPTDYTDRRTGKVTSVGQTFGGPEKAGAAFLEQKAHLASWLDLNAGARLDADDRFGVHVSPRAAAVVSPWRGGHFKALYAEAFRAPSAYERYYVDPTFQVAAPELRPETVRSVEGSFEQRAGGHRVLVTVFRTWMDDLVADAYLTDAEIAAAQKRGQLLPHVAYAQQYRNVASVTSFGASFGYEGVFLSQRLRYGLGITAAYARQFDGEGAPAHGLAVAAQLFGNARVSYDLGGPFPVVALAGRFTGSRLVDSSGFTPTPYAPPLVELRGTVSGPFPAVRGLSYRLSANGLPSAGSPYAIGPLTSPAPGYPRQATTPLDRFRVTVGLEYVFPR